MKGRSEPDFHLPGGGPEAGPGVGQGRWGQNPRVLLSGVLGQSGVGVLGSYRGGLTEDPATSVNNSSTGSYPP